MKACSPTIVDFEKGLQALMEKVVCDDGLERIRWKENIEPMEFLGKHLEKIVGEYKGNINVCDFDPQKFGKNIQSYKLAENAFTMAHAGLL